MFGITSLSIEGLGCSLGSISLSQKGESFLHYQRFVNLGNHLLIGPYVRGYAIVRILQRFERIDMRWQNEEAKMRCNVVISPAHGLKVGFWEGQGSSNKISTDLLRT